MSFRTSAPPTTPPKRKHDPDLRYVPSSQHSQHVMSSPITESLPNASGLSPYHHHHHHHHHQILVDRRHAASGSPSFVGTNKVAQIEHAAHGGEYQWVDQTLETSAVNGRGRGDLNINPALLVGSSHLGGPQKRNHITLDHAITDGTEMGGYLKKRRHDGLYETVIPLKNEHRYPPGNSQDEVIVIDSSDEEYNYDDDEGEGDEEDDDGDEEEEDEEDEEEEEEGEEEEEEEESYVPQFRQDRKSRGSRRRKGLTQSASSRVLDGWKSVRAPTPDTNDHRWAGKKAARDSTSGNGSGSGSTVSLSPASFRSPKSVAGSGQVDRGSFQTLSDVQYGSEGAKSVPTPPKGSATATSRSTPVAKKDYPQYTHHDRLHPVLKASPSNPIHTSLSPIGSSSRKEKIAATKGGHARHAKPSSPSQHPRMTSSAPVLSSVATSKGKGKAPTTAAPVRAPHASVKSPLRAGATSMLTTEPRKRTARKPTSLSRKLAPASGAATFALSSKSGITATLTTGTSTRPTRSAAAMSAFVAAGSFDTLVTAKTQRGAAPKKDPPPMTLFSYMATLDLAKDMPDPRRGWPRPRRVRRDGTNGFDILSIVPDHVVPCLQGGRLAYRDASVSASGRVKRGRVYPLYPEKLV